MTEDTDRLHELRTMPYDEYLQTPEWLERRAQALDRAERRCQVCNTPNALNVHHRTYERRGNERPGDLTVLCEGCHQLFHDKLPAPPSPFNWLGAQWSSDILFSKRFETFESWRQPGAYKIAQAFAETPSGTLILHGLDYGVGRTHLLASICNSLSSSLYVSAVTLFRVIQDHQTRHESYDWIIKQMIQTPLLALDNMDRAKRSDFRDELCFEVLDCRAIDALPTVMAINDISQLTRIIGGAVASRLSAGLIEIEMIGQDYRKEL